MYAAVDPYTGTHTISISFAYFFSFGKKCICIFIQMRFFILRFFWKKDRKPKKTPQCSKKTVFHNKRKCVIL